MVPVAIAVLPNGAPDQARLKVWITSALTGVESRPATVAATTAVIFPEYITLYSPVRYCE
jgi:hypothetical protein